MSAATNIIALVTLFMLYNCTSSIAQPNLDHEVAAVRHNSISDEIESLTDAGYESLDKKNLPQAATLFRKAYMLCQQSKGRTEEAKILRQLIDIYKRQSRWSEAEALLETNKGVGGAFGEIEVAQVLIKQGKYQEARAILRKIVPQMKPPTGSVCGNPYVAYNELQDLYNTCIKNSKDLSEEEWKKIDLERETKWTGRKDAIHPSL